jgi:hypothetical protein
LFCTRLLDIQIETIKEKETILNAKSKIVGSGKYNFEMDL